MQSLDENYSFRHVFVLENSFKFLSLQRLEQITLDNIKIVLNKIDEQRSKFHNKFLCILMRQESVGELIPKSNDLTKVCVKQTVLVLMNPVHNHDGVVHAKFTHFQSTFWMQPKLILNESFHNNAIWYIEWYLEWENERKQEIE